TLWRRQGLRHPRIRLLHPGKGDHQSLARPSNPRWHQPGIPTKRLAKRAGEDMSTMGTMGAEEGWLHKKGDLARAGWQTVVDTDTPGCQYTGIRIAELTDGQSLTLDDQG